MRVSDNVLFIEEGNALADSMGWSGRAFQSLVACAASLELFKDAPPLTDWL